MILKNFIQGAAYTIRFASPIIKAGFSSFLTETNSTIFVTKTVDEFLFEGYSDPLLNFSQALPPELQDFFAIPDYDKFGWFYNVSNFIVFNDYAIEIILLFGLYNMITIRSYWEIASIII